MMHCKMFRKKSPVGTAFKHYFSAESSDWETDWPYSGVFWTADLGATKDIKITIDF